MHCKSSYDRKHNLDGIGILPLHWYERWSHSLDTDHCYLRSFKIILLDQLGHLQLHHVYWILLYRVVMKGQRSYGDRIRQLTNSLHLELFVRTWDHGLIGICPYNRKRLKSLNYGWKLGPWKGTLEKSRTLLSFSQLPYYWRICNYIIKHLVRSCRITYSLQFRDNLSCIGYLRHHEVLLHS